MPFYDCPSRGCRDQQHSARICSLPNQTKAALSNFRTGKSREASSISKMIRRQNWRHSYELGRVALQSFTVDGLIGFNLEKCFRASTGLEPNDRRTKLGIHAFVFWEEFRYLNCGEMESKRTVFTVVQGFLSFNDQF